MSEPVADRESELPPDVDAFDLPPDERPVILDRDSDYPVDFDPEDIEWKTNKLRVVRVDRECRRCGSDVALHPDHSRPRGLIFCANCSGETFGMGQFWKEPTLSEFSEVDSDA